MPEDSGEYLDEWKKEVSMDGHFAKALLFQSTFNGAEGMYVACSTAASNRQESMNKQVGTILVPDYYRFDVYFHVGVVILNFNGIGRNGVYLGTLEHCFDQMLVSKGLNDWRRGMAIV